MAKKKPAATGPFWIPTNGDRVRVRSLDIKGTVEHVDIWHISMSYMHPIQVTLDKEWTEDGISAPTTMYRCGVEDLAKLKKKEPVPSFDEEAW